MTSWAEEHVDQLVALLPTDLREELAVGPSPNEDDCTFCEVFDAWFFCGAPGHWKGDPSKGTDRKVQSPKQRRQGAAWAALHDWHQRWAECSVIPNGTARLGKGEECYRRCLLIYRAAGWTG